VDYISAAKGIAISQPLLCNPSRKLTN